VAIWVGYLAFGLRIAKIATAASSEIVRVYYWLLPIIMAGVCESLIALVARYANAAISAKAALTVASVMALFGYIYQWMMWMHVFRCAACGVTQITYRVAWRRGVYTCPTCMRQYFKGIMGAA
jgi:hypothetical protein